MTFRWPGIIFDLASIRVLLDDVPGKGEVPIGWASHGFEDGREEGRKEGEVRFKEMGGRWFGHADFY